MNWQTLCIGDLVAAGKASIQTGPFGTQLKASDYSDDGTPVINVRNIGYGKLKPDKLEYVDERIADALAAHRLQADDIVFGRKGAVDRHLFVTVDQGEWLQGSDCIRLRFASNEIVPRFVSYALLRFEHQKWILGQAGNKATMASLNHDIIGRIALRIPSAAVQYEITAILSDYDDLVENNRRRMRLLEDAARLLYREWFVRLRFPGHEHTHITEGIPDGWERVSIQDYVARGAIELQTGPFGTQLRASDYAESGTPVINVRNIGHGSLRLDKLEFAPESVVGRLVKHVLKAGDIVFGRKGAVDRHVLVNESQGGWVQGSDCIRLRSLSAGVSTVFLSFAFREEEHKQWMLTQCSSKATMASLNQDIIGRIHLLVPQRRLLQEFNEFSSDIIKQIATLQRQSDKAAEARNLLLPRLMSGQITA